MGTGKRDVAETPSLAADIDPYAETAEFAKTLCVCAGHLRSAAGIRTARSGGFRRSRVCTRTRNLRILDRSEPMMRWRGLEPSVIAGIHTAFPEPRAHRLYHQLGDDSGH
jgi:hypothetical protein